MFVLVFYSVIEVLSGLAPNYVHIHGASGIVWNRNGRPMGRRCFVGYGKSATGPARRSVRIASGRIRRRLSSRAICSLVVLPRWGWRPLFFIGGIPALLALFVRFRVKESEVWKSNRHESWGQLVRAIASHWKLFLFLLIMLTMMNFVSHGTQDMYPTFLERYWGFGPTQRLTVTAISMIGAITGGILFGLLSDRIGRRRSMIIALVCAIAAVPLWAFAPSLTLLIVGAFLMQFMVQGAWGIIPAHLTELSPDSVRGFLPGFAYQCGVLLGRIGRLHRSFIRREDELCDGNVNDRGHGVCRRGPRHCAWPREARHPFR
jgi:SHS family lactate transporter-like MFS transporter